MDFTLKLIQKTSQKFLARLWLIGGIITEFLYFSVIPSIFICPKLLNNLSFELCGAIEDKTTSYPEYFKSDDKYFVQMGTRIIMIFLDCTLRDGGYYNAWNFSESLINQYLQAMSTSGVNIVELGLRSLQNNF